MKFQKLTPIKHDDLVPYGDALNYVFREEDLCNIAITGAYAAGKSSIIKSYEELHKDSKEFIYISLAHFDKVESENDTSKIDSNNINENTLEGKIINNIIHQIDYKKIDQSKFAIKKNISKKIVVGNSIGITSFILMMVYILKFNNIKSFIPMDRSNEISNFVKYTVQFLSKEEVLISSIILCIIIFTGYLYKLISMQLKNQLFKKIKWQNNEIEVFESKENSYFDRYLDEIIYILSGSDADAFIFEDIDRFNYNDIFNRLRDINTIINKKQLKKPIKFIYLLRDDIFNSKDRAKFFDIIIPIVPVIDNSNSYDKMLEIFKEGKIQNDFDSNFLSKVSLYIDDMRILKNIYNEYIIYKSRIKLDELYKDKNNELLAIIIYKNMFPKDFADLQLGMGFVNNLFLNKQHFIDKELIILKEEMEKNTIIISEIIKEHLNDIDELDTLFLAVNHTYEVNDKREEEFENRILFIKELKKKDAMITQQGRRYRENVDLNDIINSLDKITEYSERKIIIEKKRNKELKKLEEKNVELANNILEIRCKKLAQLITPKNIDNILKFNIYNESGDIIKYKEIINNHYYPLIKFLIRNGYINENYSDYLTCFYEESLSKKDKLFIRSIADEIAKDFNFELKNIENIVDKLSDLDFENEAILNYYLLNYLIENNHKFKEKFIDLIINKKRFDFIYKYINETEEIRCNLDEFIRIINYKWENLWNYLLDEERISEIQKKQYMILTFYFSSIEDIRYLNKYNCMTKYISIQDDFLDMDNPDIEKIINGLVAVNVKFQYINYDKSNKNLFNEVYRNNLYILNFEIINIILVILYKIENLNDITSKNYTLISSKPDAPLKMYIDSKINTYFDILFENIDVRFNDTEEVVKKILNNSNLYIEKKIRYIINMDTKIEKLNEIVWEEKIVDKLLICSCIDCTISNVLYYYLNSENKFEDIIVDFMNINLQTMEFSYNEIEEFEIIDINKFFIEVIKSNKLNNYAYKKVLNNYIGYFESFDFEGINEEKIEILINFKIIRMTKNNIEFIRENYPDLIQNFIENNILKYIKCLDDEIISVDEILQSLKNEKIEESNKIELIKIIGEDISIKGKDYSEGITLFIMENNFNKDELRYIIENYENSSAKIKCKIIKLCEENIEDIESIQISYELLNEIIISENVNEAYKKTIICNNLSELNLIQVKLLIKLANIDEFINLFDKSRCRVEATLENEKILKFLQKNNEILKYYDDKDENYYKVTKSSKK